MKQNIKNRYNIVFWVELALVLITCIITVWTFIPNNVINSNIIFRWIETLGIFASVFMFFIGIPVGLLGIILSKKMTRLRKTTIVLSLVNIFTVLMIVGLFGLIVFLVVFRGVTH